MKGICCIPYTIKVMTNSTRFVDGDAMYKWAKLMDRVKIADRDVMATPQSIKSQELIK